MSQTPAQLPSPQCPVDTTHHPQSLYAQGDNIIAVNGVGDVMVSRWCASTPPTYCSSFSSITASVWQIIMVISVNDHLIPIRVSQIKMRSRTSSRVINLIIISVRTIILSTVLSSLNKSESVFKQFCHVYCADYKYNMAQWRALCNPCVSLTCDTRHNRGLLHHNW